MKREHTRIIEQEFNKDKFNYKKFFVSVIRTFFRLTYFWCAIIVLIAVQNAYANKDVLNMLYPVILYMILIWVRFFRIVEDLVN